MAHLKAASRGSRREDQPGCPDLRSPIPQKSAPSAGVASRWRGWAAGVDELQQHLPPARAIELHQQHRLPTTDAKPAIHHRQAELVAEQHRNQVGVGVAGLIGRNALAQVQIVVEPGSFRRSQTEEEGLDVAQQPLLVFIKHQGRGGVLTNRHQQPLPYATALHQRLQVRGNGMALERSSGLDLESLKEGGGDHWPEEWGAEMVLAIAGPSPSCPRSRVNYSFVKIDSMLARQAAASLRSKNHLGHDNWRRHPA